jgi:hypothetical protein
MRSDRAPAGTNEKDPDNKLLGHWTVRRLEAEAIRDSMLQLSGKLDLTIGGESVAGGDLRRSVYVKVIRNSLDPFLTVFDAPVPSGTKGKRDVTNVPAQSLTMLNDKRVQSWAKGWAQRSSGADEARVKQMFAEAFGRSPNSKELAGSLDFIKASMHGGDEQRNELAKLEAKAKQLHERIEAILGPVRDKLTKQHATGAPVRAGGAPEPYAEWDFEDGPQDLKGRLPLKLMGNARIDHGTLVLDGIGGSFARSELLPKTLKAKTLEAWVMLDNLDQRGGGVITAQDDRGAVFDSIVFAEKANRSWVPGSDNFKRSQLLAGPLEDEATKRPVHVAISYAADGTVTAYRDGAQYGESYRSSGPAEFKKGESEIQLGCRHGNGGGNKLLVGRILRARVYDRALSADEINVTRHIEQSGVNERDVLEALDATKRDQVKAMRIEINALGGPMDTLREQLESLGGEEQAWASLALSLFNAKEFVYLR